MPHDYDQHEHDGTDIQVLKERLANWMLTSATQMEQMDEDIKALRTQTHDWMQAMLNRLPPWAVAIGSGMWTLLGAMAMWIFSHLK